MVSKAHEIITLSKNDEIIVSAKEDLQKLILFKQEQILLKQEGMFQVVENV